MRDDSRYRPCTSRAIWLLKYFSD